MKKALLIPVMLLALFLPAASAVMSPVKANNWYIYPAASTQVSVDKTSYAPGDEVAITAVVFNDGGQMAGLQNSTVSPIAGGRLRAHIIYMEDRIPILNDTMSREEYILDEFFITEDVNIMPYENETFTRTWKLPANALSGRYRVAVYLIEAESNLDGVSFLRGIYGEMSEFTVAGGTDLIYFDTAKLTINNVTQSLHLPSMAFLQGTEVTVRIPVKNDGAAADADVMYEYYLWDDLNPANIKSRSHDSVKLGSGESKMLTTKMPASVPAGAYLLKITIESPKNRAIVKIRLPILGQSILINAAGMGAFPLKSGQPAKLFVVVSNSAEAPMAYLVEDSMMAIAGLSGGAVKVSVEADGKRIFEDSTAGIALGAQTQGYEVAFTPSADYKKAVFRAEATDGAGNKDSVELAYDLDKLAKKLDVSLDISVDKDTAKMSFGLSAFGFPMTGDVDVYVEDGEGMPGLVRTVSVDGTSKIVVPGLKAGSYTATVVDKRTGSTTEKAFEVTYVPQPPVQAGGDGTGLILVLLAILVVAGILFAKRKDLAKLLPKRGPGKGKGAQSAAATAAKLKKLK